MQNTIVFKQHGPTFILCMTSSHMLNGLRNEMWRFTVLFDTEMLPNALAFGLKFPRLCDTCPVDAFPVVEEYT